MIAKEGIDDLQKRLQGVYFSATEFFTESSSLVDEGRLYHDLWNELLTPQHQRRGEELRTDVKRLSVDIAGAARGSPLIAEADLRDLRQNTRRMLASLHFKGYSYRGVRVHHDEGVILGVDLPEQHEHLLDNVSTAYQYFETAARGISDLIDLMSPADTLAFAQPGTASYRPNTAFIMMAIDKDKPDFEDVRLGIKDVCKEFGITAVTSDEIEHDDAITDRILAEIETSEFLIADLTDERPNVYYEIGHAHARNRRVILFRKDKTKIHFDIAHRNCPAYKNVTDLKTQLRRRLESVTNKPQKQ